MLAKELHSKRSITFFQLSNVGRVWSATDSDDSNTIHVYEQNIMGRELKSCVTAYVCHTVIIHGSWNIPGDDD